MTLLALECSSHRRSVALWRDGRVLVETCQSAGQSTALLALVDEALGIAAVAREAVERIAVGLGPGSYTGIRAAIAIAQGWELATAARLTGVESTAACARRCHARGLRGHTGIVVDAQRGEFYVAEYDLSTDPITLLAPLRIVSRDALGRLSRDGVQLAGPDLRESGLPGQVVEPDAAAVAELAAARETPVPGEALEPIYLRPTSFTKAAASRPLS